MRWLAVRRARHMPSAQRGRAPHASSAMCIRLHKRCAASVQAAAHRDLRPTSERAALERRRFRKESRFVASPSAVACGRIATVRAARRGLPAFGLQIPRRSLRIQPSFLVSRSQVRPQPGTPLEHPSAGQASASRLSGASRCQRRRGAGRVRAQPILALAVAGRGNERRLGAVLGAEYPLRRAAPADPPRRERRHFHRSIEGARRRGEHVGLTLLPVPPRPAAQAVCAGEERPEDLASHAGLVHRRPHAARCRLRMLPCDATFKRVVMVDANSGA